MLFGIYAVVAKIAFNKSPQGFTALLLLITFLSGVLLFFLGVIGEYVGRIYEETKRRPNYIVGEVFRSKAHPLNLLGRTETRLPATEISAGPGRRRA
jgi:hypothetical protein